MTLYKEKDIAGSRAMLERLHARLPQDPTIKRNLAVACFAMGDKDAARAIMGSRG
jgi:Flp pilus assembly protein TadD